MLNFDKKMLFTKTKEKASNVFGKAKNLKKKTKEIICVGAVACMIGSFVFYDVAAGVAHASGSIESTPYIIKAGDTELVVVKSKSDAETAIENVKLAYGKLNMETTAIVTPAISIEEKEYITAENVEVLDANEATKKIIEKNDSDNPIFKVYVEQPSIKTEAIPFETEEVATDELLKGEREVRDEGKVGVKLISSKETLVNGKVVKSEVYNSEVKQEPVKQVVLVGDKEPPAPEPVATTTNRSSSSSNSASRSSSRSTSVSYSYNAAASGGVVGYAQSFHGVPYVYGGTTPSGFDCSGFTSYVYRAYGVSLPRTSGGQGACGVAVSASEARPGDLVVYGDHVGIYAGGGLMVHAPRPGKSVSTVPVFGSPSYRRVL